MQSAARRGVVLLLATTASFGASFGAAPGCSGPTGNAAATINEYQAGVYRAFCDWQQRCGAIGASELRRCYDNFNLISSGAVDYGALVTGARVAFDSGAAGRCLDALQIASCHSGFGSTTVPECATAATGRVQPGDACTTDLECAGGYCSSSQEGCLGKCSAFPAIGAACTNVKGCGATASCDVGSHTCKARLPVASPCLSSSDCLSGLRCLPDGMGKGACSVPGTAGAPCMAGLGGFACADGFYCDGSSKICKPQLARGAACAAGPECKSGLLCLGLAPMPGSMGTCGPALDSGAACTPGTVGCPSDMSCDPMTKVCKARGLPGTPCASVEDCDFTTYCDGTTKRCTGYAAYGAACTPPVGGSTDPCVIGSCEVASKKCLILCQ